MYNQAMDHKLYDKNPNTVRRSYMLGAGKYVFALVVAGLIGFSNTSFLVVAFGIFAPVVLLIYGMIIYLKSLDREGKTKVDIALKKSSFFNVEVGLSEAFDPDVRLSTGAMVGATLQPWRAWKVDVGASLYAPVVGGRKTYSRNYLHQQLALTRNLAVRVELNQFITTLEGLAALHLYF